MGKNNRARRAANKRKREARARTGGSGSRSESSSPFLPPDLDCDCPECRACGCPECQKSDPGRERTAPSFSERVQADLRAAAWAHGTAEADALITSITAHLRRDRRLVHRMLDDLRDSVLGSAWQGGWQPIDLSEQATRTLGRELEPMVVDMIAAEHRTYAAATIDPRWAGQLRTIGAEVRWAPDRSLSDHWVERRHLDPLEAVDTGIRLVGFLMKLPQLPRLLPLPGSALARPTRQPVGVDEKVLARIRALLAKAESTEFPDEAEALSAKAQELMARYSLDRAMLAASADDSAGSAVSARRIWLASPYVSAKSMLVGAVASANRCQAVSQSGLEFTSVVGAEIDLELVELLATSLLLQASRAMLGAGSHTDRYGRSTTRSFRQSFLQSYAIRIGERLREATETTTAQVDEAESGRLLPVLARQSEQVSDLVTELFPQTYRRDLRISNHAGWAAGREAADQASLDAVPALN